jgi:hypothetical protein
MYLTIRMLRMFPGQSCNIQIGTLQSRVSNPIGNPGFLRRSLSNRYENRLACD